LEKDSNGFGYLQQLQLQSTSDKFQDNSFVYGIESAVDDEGSRLPSSSPAPSAAITTPSHVESHDLTAGFREQIEAAFRDVSEYGQQHQRAIAQEIELIQAVEAEMEEIEFDILELF